MARGINESVDQASAKYNIMAEFNIQGVVEVQDVVGALFGQTEGLLNDLDLRELQKSGRIGRIVVNADSENGITTGEVIIPSSLDRTETAILAATLETVDRVGPCKAELHLKEIRDLRESKLKQIEARAKELLKDWKAGTRDREAITTKINSDLEKDSIIKWHDLDAGEDIDKTDKVYIVEGRNDIEALLKVGIKNTISVNGTSIPKEIIELTKKKECTAFLDGDRGGEMILNELVQVSDVKFFARAPLNYEVEALNEREIVKALQAKRPISDWINERKEREEKDRESQQKSRNSRGQQRNSRDNRRGPKDQRISKKSSSHREKKTYKKPDPVAVLPPIYKEMVKTLISSNEAIILDKDDKEVHRTRNIRIFEELNGQGGQTIIMDGVVTQRFLDKAIDTKINQIIAVNHNPNLRFPEKIPIKLYYFKDFL